MRPGEMDGVKKESASDIGTPPGGPCRPALPGLSPYWDGEKVIVPEEIYDGAHWDIMGEAPKLKKVFVVHLKKMALILIAVFALSGCYPIPTIPGGLVP